MATTPTRAPNGMRHFEQSLRAVALLDIDDALVFELIGQLDDYVFGYALRELHEQAESERGWPPEVVEFLQREIDSGERPLIRRFLGDDAGAGIERILTMFDDGDRFDRGLRRLLDGFEAEAEGLAGGRIHDAVELNRGMRGERQQRGLRSRRLGEEATRRCLDTAAAEPLSATRRTRSGRLLATGHLHRLYHGVYASWPHRCSASRAVPCCRARWRTPGRC